MLLEQFVDRLGRVGFVDLLAKLSLHMEPANLGQCLDVVAHLIGPARQEDNQADGLAIDGLKVDRLSGLADRHRHIAEHIRLAVRNRQALPDTGGSRLFTRPDRFLERRGIGDLARLGERLNQLVDDLVLLDRLERREDAFRSAFGRL